MHTTIFLCGFFALVFIGFFFQRPGSYNYSVSYADMPDCGNSNKSWVRPKESQLLKLLSKEFYPITKVNLSDKKETGETLSADHSRTKSMQGDMDEMKDIQRRYFRKEWTKDIGNNNDCYSSFDRSIIWRCHQTMGV